MKLAFMSSVFPKLGIDGLIEKATTFGYVGIEFRPQWGHGHGVELETDVAGRAEIKRQMADAGLASCCVSPGTRFGTGEKAECDSTQEELYRYIGLAAEMGIPRIRTFGDTLPNGGSGKRQRGYDVRADYIARAAERAAAAGVVLVLETHGNFRGFDAGEILYRVGYSPGLAVNWHLAHCIGHGEDIDEAYRHVKGRVRHVHFGMQDEDEADAKIHRQAELLIGEGYDEYFSVEVIDPPDGDEVLQRNADAWAKMMAKLGRQ